MIIVHVYVHVTPESVDAFAAASLENADHSVDEPGISRFDVIQQQDDPTRFMLVEVYRDAAAMVAHKETAHYATWRDAVAPMMAEPRRSVKYDAVSPTDDDRRAPSAGAVIYAHSLPVLSAFYEGLFGLAVTERATDHVLLTSPALRLVIVAIPAHIAATFTIDSPPQLREEAAVKLVFGVDSIASVRERARAHGGRVLAPEREWEFDGYRVCDGNDPEGNVLQLRERLR